MAREAKCIGILTAGGDCQGLNAAIRAVGKTAIHSYGMDVVGIQDGFKGLVENRAIRMEDDELSGILTHGGTILGTSRSRPDRYRVGDSLVDMTAQAVQNYHAMHLDALVCLGGGGTQKNAFRLSKRSEDINIITLPKTIDNDVWGTEVCFGYDTAVQIATEAIDRLHSTASSHGRVMVVEIMGHNTGWLAASAGLAGGADIVLIPEIPYHVDRIVADLIERKRKGKRFSIVAVAEGAMSHAEAEQRERGKNGKLKRHKSSSKGSVGVRITAEIEERTGLQCRLTTLGHTQRGGTPSAFDRILATKLGTKAVALVAEGQKSLMVAAREGQAVAVPLDEVAGKRRHIPLDDPIIESLRSLHICLGDR